MAWWDVFFRARKRAPSAYRVAFNLYSRDGKRGAEVRERRDGSWYFVDQEWVQGTTFKYRAMAEEIGPFESSSAAEAAVVVRHWFNYGDDPGHGG
jgi:hypothetical protein